MARILLIDDAVDLRDALMHALRSEGHIVAVAGDGAEGVALQTAFRADILVTDIFMPNKDGIETIQEFRQTSPDTRIVVMSAGGKLNSPLYLTIAEQLGVDETLQKPFGIQDLLAVIARMEKAML